MTKENNSLIIEAGNVYDLVSVHMGDAIVQLVQKARWVSHEISLVKDKGTFQDKMKLVVVFEAELE